MKKIVGIIGMAAMLASAAFALDVSASLKVSGEILNGHADHNDSTFGMFKTDTGAADFAVASFSAGDDVAGASFGIKFKSFGVTEKAKDINDVDYYTDAEAKFLTFDPTDGKVWFKPFNDALNGALKVTLGNVGKFTTGSIELAGDTVGFLTSFNVADLGLGIDFIMDTKNEKGYSYFKMREAGTPDGLDMIGLKATFANETIGNIQAAFTYDHIAAWNLKVGLAYAMPTNLVEGLSADLGLGFDFQNRRIKNFKGEEAAKKKEAEYYVYNAVPTQKLNVAYKTEAFSVGLSEELNFDYKAPVRNKHTFTDDEAKKYAGVTKEMVGKTISQYYGDFDYDAKKYPDEAKDLILKPVALSLTLNGSYNLMDDLTVSAKVGAKFDFQEWEKIDNQRAAYKTQNTDVNVKLASSNADFFKPYVEFDYANWFGYYETKKEGKVADAASYATVPKKDEKGDVVANEYVTTSSNVGAYGKNGSHDSSKMVGNNPTLKLNAGISGSIGAMDWTLGMENTFTMIMNIDGSNGGTKHKSFNTVYDVKVPFTCAVKF